MAELIREIVNEWDPFNLLRSYGCPPDEYKHEVRAIAGHIYEDITVDELSMKIRCIFVNHFGETGQNLATRPIAKKIIMVLKANGILGGDGSAHSKPSSSQ